MATVTVYTAERMKEIEDSSIVSTEVVNGHLIITKFDGTTVDAGSVIGPQGVQGPPGPIDQLAQLVDVDTAGATPGEALFFDGSLWTPGAIPTPPPPTLPTPGQVGGFLSGSDGVYNTGLAANSTVYQEVNIAGRAAFTVPPSGQVMVVMNLMLDVQTGSGHGGGFGVSEIGDVPNPLCVEAWGATQAGMSNPIVGQRYAYSLANIVPNYNQRWTPGQTKTLTAVVFKNQGPIGGGAQVVLGATIQVFALAQAVI